MINLITPKWGDQLSATAFGQHLWGSFTTSENENCETAKDCESSTSSRSTTVPQHESTSREPDAPPVSWKEQRHSFLVQTMAASQIGSPSTLSALSLEQLEDMYQLTADYDETYLNSNRHSNNNNSFTSIFNDYYNFSNDLWNLIFPSGCLLASQTSQQQQQQQRQEEDKLPFVWE